MAGEVREPSITHVTVTGRVIPLDKNSYMELVLLAYRFRKSLVKAVKMYAKGIDRNTIEYPRKNRPVCTPQSGIIQNRQ